MIAKATASSRLKFKSVRNLLSANQFRPDQ